MGFLDDSNGRLVLSYLELRKAIGVVGISLPVVLAVGKVLVEGPGIEVSVSAYYYTAMRDVFVGILVAMGIFLLSYRGYQRIDDIAGDLACLFAVGIAFLPTAPRIEPTAGEMWVGYLHTFCAAMYFVVQAYFALVLFRKTDDLAAPTGRKLLRNRVYQVCGIMILLSLLLVAAVLLGFGQSVRIYRFDPVFWIESVAITAIGIAWLVKGGVVLRDQ